MSLSENSPSTQPVLEAGIVAPIMETGIVAPIMMDNNFLTVKMMTTRFSIDSGIGNFYILNNHKIKNAGCQ